MANPGFRASSGDYGFSPGAARITLPRGVDPTGLEWIHFMTDGLVAALRNWAPGKSGLDAVVTGSPIEHDGYLELKSNTNFLTMHLTDSGQSITRFIGSRDVSTQTGTDRFFFGGAGFAGSPTIHGANIFTAAANSVQGSARYSNGSSPVSRNVFLPVAGGPASPMRLFTLTTGGVGSTAGTDDDLRVSEYVSGASGSEAQGDGYARVGTGAKFGSGGATAVTITGSGHSWIDIGFSRVLSAKEKLIMTDWLIKTGQAHGHYL